MAQNENSNRETAADAKAAAVPEELEPGAKCAKCGDILIEEEFSIQTIRGTTFAICIRCSHAF